MIYSNLIQTHLLHS